MQIGSRRNVAAPSQGHPQDQATQHKENGHTSAAVKKEAERVHQPLSARRGASPHLGMVAAHHKGANSSQRIEPREMVWGRRVFGGKH
jgi:hypothetical protein